MFEEIIQKNPQIDWIIGWLSEIEHAIESGTLELSRNVQKCK